MRFVDTNVLLYAVSVLPKEFTKRREAKNVLRRSDLAVSVQVLQEFYFQATHPARTIQMSHDDAVAFLGPFLRFPVQEINPDLFRAAVVNCQRFQISYWDGAILAAARILGCDAVYSEDLSSEQVYDGMRVINPFREATKV